MKPLYAKILGTSTFIGTVIVFIVFARWYKEYKTDEALGSMIGAGCFVLGHIIVGLIILIKFISQSKLIKKLSDAVLLKQRYFDFRPVKAEELNFLYSEFLKLFGNDLLSFNELRNIHEKNPNTVWLVQARNIDVSSSPPVNIGFFEFFPLTESAVSKLEEGSIDGRNLKSNLISSPLRNSSNYYIGGIGLLPSKNMSELFLKGVVLKSFSKFLILLNQEKAINLFARPISEDGLRLLKDRKFKKLHNSKADNLSIWKLSLSRNELKHDSE